MELLFFLLIIVGVLSLISKAFDAQAERDRCIERERERKRSPIYCDLCRKPNKNIGASTAEEYKVTGPKRLKLCGDCQRKYSFCSNCEEAITDKFHIYDLGTFCKTCFEKTPRHFRDTRRAAHLYHGSECKICGSTRNLEVHHKTYAREGIELFDDLVVLCKSCHNLQHSTVHTGPKGGKYVIRKGRKKYIRDAEIAYQLGIGDRRPSPTTKRTTVET